MAVALYIDLGDRGRLADTLYQHLVEAIVGGQLREGDRLPPTRQLAASLRVSRSTVTAAYDRLAGDGYLTARVGSGTFVAARRTGIVEAVAPEPAPTAVWLKAQDWWKSRPTPYTFPPVEFDFTSGFPDATRFPYESWRRLLSRQFRAGVMGRAMYSEPAGHRGLREAIAHNLQVARGIRANAADITIVNGTQQALDILTRVIVAPGQAVAMEDPGYGMALRTFGVLGTRVSCVPLDTQGLRVDQLPDDIRLIYVTPTHQFPMGMTMSLERRLELLQWAKAHGAAILEDDYDSEFHRDPGTPLHTLDAEQSVVYVGSFSKSLLPVLRLGFILAPPSLHAAIHAAKQLMDWHTNLPMQAALAEFIDTGGFARHVRKMRGIYERRRAALVRALNDQLGQYVEVVPPAAGMHLCAHAKPSMGHTLETAAREALASGVRIQALSDFSQHPNPRRGLVLGYGLLDEEQIAQGVQRLMTHLPAATAND
jgi:GntR family transcriptional regulator / MocR family aminotransferase